MKKLIAHYLPKGIGIAINTLHWFDKERAARKAFDVFSKVRKGRILEEHQSFITPARHKKLSVDGNTIQTYHWPGSGKTILLVHGWESNSYRWFKLVEDLRAKGYNLYAFDAPAHGDSTGVYLNVVIYSHALDAVIKEYQPQHLIAHSIGGLTSLFHQFHFGYDFEKMVILGSASDLGDIMKDYQRLLGLTDGVMKSLEHYLQNKYGFSFEAFSGAAFAKAVTAEGLIIHDAYDKITPVSASRAIHQNWPNSTYVETEGLGHSLYQKEVRESILQFLEK